MSAGRTVERRGRNWFLVSSSGRVLGRHDSEEGAWKQDRAIRRSYDSRDGMDRVARKPGSGHLYGRDD